MSPEYVKLEIISFLCQEKTSSEVVEYGWRVLKDISVWHRSSSYFFFFCVSLFFFPPKWEIFIKDLSHFWYLVIVFLLCFFGPTDSIPEGFRSAAVRLVTIVTRENTLQLNLLPAFHFQTAPASRRRMIQSDRRWVMGVLKFNRKTKELFDPTLTCTCATTCEVPDIPICIFTSTCCGDASPLPTPGFLCLSEGIDILLFDVSKRCVLKTKSW